MLVISDEHRRAEYSREDARHSADLSQTQTRSKCDSRCQTTDVRSSTPSAAPYRSDCKTSPPTWHAWFKQVCVSRPRCLCPSLYYACLVRFAMPCRLKVRWHSSRCAQEEEEEEEEDDEYSESQTREEEFIWYLQTSWNVICPRR